MSLLIVHVFEALDEKTCEAFARAKAFYDNLPEEVKDGLSRAMKEIKETMICIRQSTNTDALFKELATKLVDLFKSFFGFAKQASKQTKNRFKLDNNGLLENVTYGVSQLIKQWDNNVCATSVNMIMGLAISIRKLGPLIVRLFEVSYEKICKAFHRVRAFFDKLSKKVKDGLIRAKTEIEKAMHCVRELVSDWSEWAVVSAFKKLTELRDHVKSFFSCAKEATEQTSDSFVGFIVDVDDEFLRIDVEYWVSQVQLIKLWEEIILPSYKTCSTACNGNSAEMAIEFVCVVLEALAAR